MVGRATELPKGLALGRYEIIERLAVGGMAEIYLARVRGEAGFDKLIAVKRILPTVAVDQTFVEMFLAEARLAATLRHPNIADVFDVGIDDGSYFFAMEFIHGQDLRAIRMEAEARGERVPLQISLAVVSAIASALSYAHTKAGVNGPLNLVHRDISPSNILVSYDGAVKLVDFGIARAETGTNANRTRTGMLKGKIPYMSPEQCRAKVLDGRADLFSLGTVFYELTTGVRPFVGNGQFDTLEKIVHGRPERPSSIVPDYPIALEEVVMRLLANKRGSRYQDAAALLSDLELLTNQLGLFASAFMVGKYMRELFDEESRALPHVERESSEYRLEQAEEHTIEYEAEEPPQQAGHETGDPAPEFRVVFKAGSGRPSGTYRAEREPIAENPIAARNQRITQPLPAARSKPATTTPPVAAKPATTTPPVAAKPRRAIKPSVAASLLARPPAPMRREERQSTAADPLFVEERSSAITSVTPRTGDETHADAILPFDPIAARCSELISAIDPDHADDRDLPAETIAELVQRATTWLDAGDLENAVIALEVALSADRELAGVVELLHANHDLTITIFEAYIGDRTRLLALSQQIDEIADIPIDRRAAYLLSLLDDSLSVDELIARSGMPLEDAYRHLCQLMLRELVVLV